jgi:hypothetical protein
MLCTNESARRVTAEYNTPAPWRQNPIFGPCFPLYVRTKAIPAVSEIHDSEARLGLVAFGKYLVLAATTLARWAAVAMVLVVQVWLMRRRRLLRARSPGRGGSHF